MCKGSKHDFELFIENLKSIPKGSLILADKSYQQIYDIYEKVWSAEGKKETKLTK